MGRVGMKKSKFIYVMLNGYEVLNTSGGDDQLYPGLGIDTINGGNSFDIAHYQNLEEPIDVYGTVEPNINAEQKSSNTLKK